MRNQHKTLPRPYRSNADAIPAAIVAVLITIAAVAWGFLSSHLPTAQQLATYPTVAALPHEQ